MLRRLLGRGAWLRIDRRLWSALVEQLALRGHGTHESGAFLLAASGDPTRVLDVAYFDDLDATATTHGLRLDADAFVRLWRFCAERRLTVVADVHTHPSEHVCQSRTDRENPMVASVGHVALIVPRFASGSPTGRELGAHRYLGDRGWQTSCTGDAQAAVYIGRFA